METLKQIRRTAVGIIIVGLIALAVIQVIKANDMLKQIEEQNRQINYNNGYLEGREKGDQEGFQRCYDARKSFP